jgi:hypothetical protein
MSDEVNNGLLSLANSAGYLLQLRVQHEIETTAGTHGWHVPAIEHYWKHPATGQHGYIDLVVADQGGFRLVVECKRVRVADWVFLVRSEMTQVRRLTCLGTVRSLEKPPLIVWADVPTTTPSYESHFCVVKGHADKDRPTLERLADELLPSVEALALQELDIGEAQVNPQHQIYVPVLLTTARLQVCTYDPGAISLATGELPTADFQEVPFIRFRKGLSAQVPTARTPRDLAEANRERERSILVVSASSLVSLLRKFDLTGTGGLPWGWL